MNIYLLYKTEDMKNMTQADVRDVKNTLEGSLKNKPVYDLAVIDGVLWRVGVAETDENPGKVKTLCSRLDIPSNNQGFRGTALSPEGYRVNTEFIYKIANNTGKPIKRRYNLS